MPSLIRLWIDVRYRYEFDRDYIHSRRPIMINNTLGGDVLENHDDIDDSRSSAGITARIGQHPRRC